MIKNLLTEIKNSEEAKQKGNEFFSTGAYKKAYQLYTLAVDLVQEDTPKENISIFYCNRATASFKLEYYAEALKDCESSLEFNPGNVKAYYRKAYVLLRLNKLEQAESTFTLIKNKFPSADLKDLEQEIELKRIILAKRNEEEEKLKEYNNCSNNYNYHNLTSLGDSVWKNGLSLREQYECLRDSYRIMENNDCFCEGGNFHGLYGEEAKGL